MNPDGSVNGGGQLVLNPGSSSAVVAGNVINGNYWPNVPGGTQLATNCYLGSGTANNSGIEGYGAGHQLYNNEVEQNLGSGIVFPGILNSGTEHILISSANPRQSNDSPRYIEANAEGGIVFLGPMTNSTQFPTPAQGVILDDVLVRGNALTAVVLDGVQNASVGGVNYYGFTYNACLSAPPGYLTTAPLSWNTLVSPTPTNYAEYTGALGPLCPTTSWSFQVPLPPTRQDGHGRRSRMKSFLMSAFVWGISLMGQTGPIPISSSYTLSAPFYAAPGQLVTLTVGEIGNTFYPTVQATPSANLPTSLAGIAVGYWQSGSSSAIPILQVQPFWTCGGYPYFCGPLLAVTVQIPFEAQCISCSENGGVSPGQLSVSLNGSAVTVSIYADIVTDQVHILTGCDAFISPIQESFPATGLSCPSTVTHADGSPVSATSPAKAGEELVAYAVGLGQTNPASVTGQLVTKSAPTLTTYTLDYNYHPNALPSRPLPTGPQPAFAGTTAGYVGLYQVNFVVPPIPAGTPPCVDTSTLQAPYNVVQSNLTVSIGGQFSFDGARICVATQ